MKVEVIVPAARGNLCQRLVWSLSRQTRKPDRVTLVGNETDEIDPHGLNVSLLRLKSDHYLIGRGDVCLRRNAGAWFTDAEVLIFQDDDQMAPPDLVASALERIEQDGYVYGHHRYVEFDEDFVFLGQPPDRGASRERGVNRLHGWQSAYAGMFGIKRDLFWAVGGFDMAFEGLRGNEDQQFGRRLLKHMGQDKIFIAEPPFAWHPNVTSEFLNAPAPSKELIESFSVVRPFEPRLVKATRRHV